MMIEEGRVYRTRGGRLVRVEGASVGLVAGRFEDSGLLGAWCGGGSYVSERNAHPHDLVEVVASPDEVIAEARRRDAERVDALKRRIEEDAKDARYWLAAIALGLAVGLALAVLFPYG